MVVKRDTGYVPSNTPNSTVRRTPPRPSKIVSKVVSKRATANNTTANKKSLSAFGGAAKRNAEVDELTPEELQKVREQRAAKRKAFEERNRQQLIALQNKKQKQKEDAAKKEAFVKRKRLKLREAARRAAEEKFCG